jgi:succinoglycan biosynthesis transport protein ExoP
MKPYDYYEIIPSPDRILNRSVLRSDSADYRFQEHSYTWEQVVRVLRNNLVFSLLVVGALTGAVLFYALMQRDFYRPTARLEIAPPGSGIKTLHEIESTNEADNQDYLETQVQILGSDALAVSVIRALRLDKNPEFVSSSDAKRNAPAKVSPVASVAVPSELALVQEQLDLATLTPAESTALDRFRSNLSVSSIRNTRLVELSYSSHDPKLAQLIANTLVTKFIDQNYRHHYTSTMQASEWLSSQLTDLRRKVEESGQAVSDYQKKYGLVEVDDRDVPMSQLMTEVNHQLSEAQASRIEQEAYIRMIDQGHSDAVPALRDDRLYQDLSVRYSDLRTQLVQVKATYGDANSNVKRLVDQVNEVSLQIDAERNRTIARTRSSYAAAEHREGLMLQEREKLRSQMGQVSSRLTTFHMLKNEANANAELYNTLQGRLQEAGIYAGLRSSNIRVVDLATNLRKATGPHRSMLVVLGLIGSCLFAVVLSFVREGFRNTVRTPDDVKSWTGLPSIALLPIMRASAAKAQSAVSVSQFGNLGQPSSVNGTGKPVSIMKAPNMESESMRDLRTTLLHSKPGRGPNVILISSSMEGEGKTTVAVNLAIALSQLGPTCLLEADLRQPTVANAFQLEPQAGLTEVLESSASMEDVLRAIPGIENLSVIPCGNIPASPADTLSSPRLIAVMHALRQDFDYVVIDSPPVIRFSDARYLSSLSDAVVIVGRCGISTRRAMQRSTELFKEVNASVAGVVLNGVDFSSPDYDYYTYGYRHRPTRSYDSTQINSNDSDHTDKPRAMGAHA